MTRAELIRKLARQAGVPDSESRIFFEIFLRKLTAILKIGQSLRITSFGYFYLLQGKIIQPSDDTEQDNIQHENIDLIYFSSKKVNDLKKLDGIFFNVPVSDEDEFNSVDAAFSLSFGKPLIPFKGYVENDFYIPHTGSELRRLIESKVEKNIENSEIGGSTDLLQATIEIDSDIFNQSVIKSEDFSDEDIIDRLSDEESSINITKISEKDLISISGAFDKDLNRQIEEESIIDSADEVDEKSSVINWEFSSFDDIESEKNISENQLPADEKSELKKEEKKEIEDKDEDDKRIEVSETDKPAISEKFERVKTLNNLIDERDKKQKIDSETKRVQPDKIKKVNLPEIVAHTTGHKVKQTPEDKKRSEPEIQLAPSKPEKKFSSLDSEKEKFRQRRIKSRSSITPYIMLLVSVLIIGYSIYYYINNIKGFADRPAERVVSEFNTDRMIIVEREFDFPITYPYPKRTEGILNSLNIFDLKEDKVSESDPLVEIHSEVEATIPEETKIVQPELVVNDQPPSGEIKRLGINLFQYGSVYIVQVAAFRSNSVAQNEAGRFRNKGYNAFVERAEIDGSIWHRVKVGNFTDLEEAKKFAVQFK